MNYVVIGYGGRGDVYSSILKNNPKVKLIAVCDIDKNKLNIAKQNFGLDSSFLFDDEDEFFSKGKLADIAFICTQDKLHHRHAIKALNAGYDLLLEKPIATDLKSCMEIIELSKKLNRKVFVGHVLRYSPFFNKIKQELNSGNYGKVVTINITENVGYKHQAHSYVRGNWADTNSSTPMIVAKCCHDLDLLQFFVGNPCESVSSFGSLTHFTAQNAPEGCADRCFDCKYFDTCKYSVKNCYINLAKNGMEKNGKIPWPADIVCGFVNDLNVLTEKLKTGNYGRCVYKCSNNAVDHQVVNLLFKGGQTAHLTMTAFSESIYREIHVHCENGEIYGNMLDNILHCNLFNKESKQIDATVLGDTDYGHGGGDKLLLDDIIASYEGGSTQNLTSIELSFASHVIGFNAELSRLKGGELIKL